jgi:hypothetical protein
MLFTAQGDDIDPRSLWVWKCDQGVEIFQLFSLEVVEGGRFPAIAITVLRWKFAFYFVRNA